MFSSIAYWRTHHYVLFGGFLTAYFCFCVVMRDDFLELLGSGSVGREIYLLMPNFFLPISFYFLLTGVFLLPRALSGTFTFLFFLFFELPLTGSIYLAEGNWQLIPDPLDVFMTAIAMITVGTAEALHDLACYQPVDTKLILRKAFFLQDAYYCEIEYNEQGKVIPARNKPLFCKIGFFL